MDKKPKKPPRPRVRDDKPARQRAYSKRMVAQGRCAICGRPRNNYACYCDRHGDYRKAYERERRGCKAWRPGGPGRPPNKKPKGGKR